MFTYIILGFGLACLYKSDTYNVIKDKLSEKYYKWRNLTNFISNTKDTNHLQTNLITIKILLQAVYIAFIQYMNKSVVKLNHKTYEVSYSINGKLYKMIVSPKRGPEYILQVSNEKQNDITSIVIPYLGPNYDWHNKSFTPNFFNCKLLNFELNDGSEKTFYENQIIDLNC